MENNIKDAVNHAFDDNPVAMRDALYNEINDKIFAAIQQRKIEIAASLLEPKESE
jgi:hypothetical protein